MLNPGEKTPVLDKWRLSHLIRAQQLLKIRDKLDAKAIEICEFARDWPLHINRGHCRAIYAIWMTAAEAGQLRGVKKMPLDIGGADLGAKANPQSSS